MKKRSILLVLVIGVLVLLLATNPNEGDYREHIRQEEGLAGTLGMAMADLLSGSKNGGIKRDNYFVASRFYLGGDGVVPRQNLAWGVAGMFFKVE